MKRFEDEFVIQADHPALPGHFPGMPVVPGALIIDETIAAIRRHGNSAVSGVRQAKFTAPLPVGAPCRVRVTPRDDGAVAVSCMADDVPVMTAVVDCASSKGPE